jgi:hypothetical protein
LTKPDEWRDVLIGFLDSVDGGCPNAFRKLGVERAAGGATVVGDLG